MKIVLSGREIPRKENGDPNFKFLHEAYEQRCVLDVFTEPEVVELVNRAIYQLEYQHQAHRVRGQRVRDQEKLIREAVKRLFHISWLKATPGQIAEARKEVEKANPTGW